MNAPQHPLLPPSCPISAWKHAGSSSGCFVFLQHHARCCQLTNKTASPPQTSPISPALGTQHMSPGTTQGCSAQAGIIRQGFIGRCVGTAAVHNLGQGRRLCPHHPHGKVPLGILRLLSYPPKPATATWPHLAPRYMVTPQDRVDGGWLHHTPTKPESLLLGSHPAAPTLAGLWLPPHTSREASRASKASVRR